MSVCMVALLRQVITLCTTRLNIFLKKSMFCRIVHVFYVDLGTISSYFPVEYYSFDFYIRDGMCVLRRYEMNI